MRFVLSDRLVFDAFRNDDKLPFADELFIVAKFHPEGAFNDKEQLVFVVVVMPDKFAFEFDELDVRVIQLRNDFWIPVLLKQSEFV